MFQIIDVLTGRVELPPEFQWIRNATRPPRNMGSDVFRDLDVALVEVGSPVEISFRGMAINFSHIHVGILQPVERQSREAHMLCQRWLRVGLVGMNEEVREDLGAQIERLIPDDEEGERRRAVLREARVVKADIAGGFRKLRDRLGCPIGVVIYIFGYMPDGRPIAWPPGLRDEVVAAAREFGFPVFEPVKMVQDFGVARALEQDGRHYTEAFLPIVGEAIARFALDVHAQAVG